MFSWLKRLFAKRKNKSNFELNSVRVDSSMPTSARTDLVELSAELNQDPEAVGALSEGLLDKARTQWQFGDWNSLTTITREQIEHQPDKAKIALFVATGHSQSGNFSEAASFIRLSKDWGCPHQLLARHLVSGVFNTIARAMTISQQPEKSIEYFSSSIDIASGSNTPRLIVNARVMEQRSQLIARSQSISFLGNSVRRNFPSPAKPNYKSLVFGPSNVREKLALARLEVHRKRESYKLLANGSQFSNTICTAPLISIIMASCRPENIELIVKNIGGQKYSNKEVIIVTQRYSSDEILRLKYKLNGVSPNLRRFLILEDDSQSSLGKRQNLAVENAEGDYWAKFDDDDIYFSNYLSDMLINSVLGDNDIVAKCGAFYLLNSTNDLLLRFPNIFNQYVNNANLRGATLFVKASRTTTLIFGDQNQGEDTVLIDKAQSLGLRIYASDPFNAIICRSANLNNHTFKISDDELYKQSEYVASGADWSKVTV